MYCLSQTVSAREMEIGENVLSHHVSHVNCQVLHVMDKTYYAMFYDITVANFIEQSFLDSFEITKLSK